LLQLLLPFLLALYGSWVPLSTFCTTLAFHVCWYLLDCTLSSPAFCPWFVTTLPSFWVAAILSFREDFGGSCSFTLYTFDDRWCLPLQAPRKGCQLSVTNSPACLTSSAWVHLKEYMGGTILKTFFLITKLLLFSPNNYKQFMRDNTALLVSPLRAHCWIPAYNSFCNPLTLHLACSFLRLSLLLNSSPM
jgi:hypothetical protein